MYERKLADAEALGGDTLADVWATLIETKSPVWSEAHRDLHVRHRGEVTLAGLGRRPIRDIRPLEVQRHLNQLAASSTSRGQVRMASGVQQRLKYLRAAFNYAVDIEMIDRSPARNAEVPEGLMVAERDIPKLADIVADLDAALATLAPKASGRSSEAHVWMPLVCRLAIATGARSGEIVGIRYSDLEGSELTLQRHVLGKTGEVVPGLKAKKKPRRRMRLDPVTLAMIKATRARVSDELMGQGLGPVADDAYVITLDGGLTPLNPNVARRWWARVRDAMGRPNLRLHDIRHAFASDMLEAGMNPATIAERLGHSLRELLDTYSHARSASDEAMAAYVESLDSESPDRT